jgi:pimeloyl-ACP methyl ester carboxylesterase
MDFNTSISYGAPSIPGSLNIIPSSNNVLYSSSIISFAYLLIILNPTLSLTSLWIGYENLTASGYLIIFAIIIKDLVEKEFVVVYWDQRFAGNTQGNGGNVDITEFRKDIKNLVLLLGDKYGSASEIYLLGHSWGGFLAPYFLVDGDNQKMVKGWIQVGGAHNYNLNDYAYLNYMFFESCAQAKFNPKSTKKIKAWINLNMLNKFIFKIFVSKIFV